MGDDAGITGMGGGGGEMIIGPGGNTGAGTGGAGGSNPGMGGCGGTDAGPAIDAGTCDPPTEAPDAPTVTTVSAACTNYCTDMANGCAGTYTDVTQCQRYCTLAGWRGRVPAPIGPRRARSPAAMPAPSMAGLRVRRTSAPPKCRDRGPQRRLPATGAPCRIPGQCGKFCCGLRRRLRRVTYRPARTRLRIAARRPPSPAASPWLLLASGDRHYCPLVDLDPGSHIASAA